MMASIESMELEAGIPRARDKATDGEDLTETSRRRRVDAIIILIVVVAVALILGIVFGVVKRGSSDIGSSELTRWSPQGDSSDD